VVSWPVAFFLPLTFYQRILLPKKKDFRTLIKKTAVASSASASNEEVPGEFQYE